MAASGITSFNWKDKKEMYGRPTYDRTFRPTLSDAAFYNFRHARMSKNTIKPVKTMTEITMTQK